MRLERRRKGALMLVADSFGHLADPYPLVAQQLQGMLHPAFMPVLEDRVPEECLEAIVGGGLNLLARISRALWNRPTSVSENCCTAASSSRPNAATQRVSSSRVFASANGSRRSPVTELWRSAEAHSMISAVTVSLQ
jgi:hypothetical protein